MISESKIKLLQAACGNPTDPDVAATTVGWERHMELLYPEAQRFHGWAAARYDSKHARGADHAVAARAMSGNWPKVIPGVGRLLYARLVQAIAVIAANELADPSGGTTMPAGLSDDRLAGACIAFWIYEMELLLPEKPEQQHGVA
jgi:hypothetical protein